MTDFVREEPQKQTFSFFRGGGADASIRQWPEDADHVRKALSESLNAKNVSFLLGAGCSSYYAQDPLDEWLEVGIPTMAPLATEFTKPENTDMPGFPNSAERKILAEKFGINISDQEYARNLERLMELLFSLRFALSRNTLESAAANLEIINSLIGKVQAFLWNKCTNGAFAHGDDSVRTLYETFTENSFCVIARCHVRGFSLPIMTSLARPRWTGSVSPMPTASLE